MRFSSSAAIGWMVLLATSEAQAQSYYGDYRASTVGESYARGYADVVRSAGQYNLQTSEALINVEQARSLNFANRIQYTQTFFEMRKMNRQYRAEERGPPRSSETLARLAAEAAPKRLSPGELDPVDGGISWPILLQADYFGVIRTEVEKAYEIRADKQGAIGVEQYLKIQNDSKKMIAMLKEIVGTVPPGDYIHAKRFLESLAQESKYPTG